MEKNFIDLDKLTVEELKIIAYDLFVQIETLNQQLQLVRQVINSRQKELDK